jgi:hypothetical protein
MRPRVCTLRGRIPSDRADTVTRPETPSVCPDPAGSSSLDPQGHRLRLGLGGDFSPARPDPTQGSFWSAEIFLP